MTPTDERAALVKQTRIVVCDKHGKDSYALCLQCERESLQAQVAALTAPQSASGGITNEMVDRFLGWRLPEHFCPDGGISFKASYNENTPYPGKHEPIGTNLFSADQARQMLEYVLATSAAPPACREEARMAESCPICAARDPSEKVVADMVTAAVIWYKAPLEKRAAAEAVLRRQIGNLLHQPEEITT